MVWGMQLPDKFGEFWPEGVLEMDPETYQDGWFDRLRNYYSALTTAERKELFDYKWNDGNAALKYSGFVSDKFTLKIGSEVGDGCPPLTPIEPHEVPQSYTTRPYRSLGSIISLSRGPEAVDGELKDIIEKFEPGVHKFFPIKMYIGLGEKQLDKQYYVLYVGQYFDAYAPDKNDTGKPPFVGNAFRRSAYGDAHLWKDINLREPIFFSDELMTEIDRAKLRLPRRYKMKEV